jgi:hypothetical protein
MAKINTLIRVEIDRLVLKNLTGMLIHYSMPLERGNMVTVDDHVSLDPSPVGTLSSPRPDLLASTVAGGLSKLPSLNIRNPGVYGPIFIDDEDDVYTEMLRVNQTAGKDIGPA